MIESQRQLTKPFYALLSLPATAMGFALSVQISALSWILSAKYGLAIEEVGLVWAAGPIAGILGQVLIGVLSDKVWFWNGRRRPFILIGGVLASLMLLALPKIDVISASMGFDGILGVAIAVALTLDLAINVSFNPTRSIIADVTPEGVERTKGYTWMQTISGTFGVLAYLIGALIDNYTLIYFGAALVLLFSIIPTLFIEEPRDLAGEGADTPAPGFPLGEIMTTIQPLWGFLIYAVYGMTIRLAEIDVGNHYVEIACVVLTVFLIGKALFARESDGSDGGLIGFRKVLAAHSFTWVGVQTMFIYMYAYLQYRMPDLEGISLGSVVAWGFFFLNLVGALLPVLVLEPLTERIGRVRTHALSLAVMTAGYAGLIFFGRSPMAIYALMVVLGVGWAAVVSLPFAIMSQKVSQSKMGLYMGLFNLSVVLPQLVASLGIGQVISVTDDKTIIFVICAGSLLISTVSWLMVKEAEA